MKYVIRDKASGNEVFPKRYATQAEAEASLREFLCSDELIVVDTTGPHALQPNTRAMKPANLGDQTNG